MNQYYNASTSAWLIDGAEDTKTTAIWELLGLIVILALFMMFLKIADIT